MQGGFVAMATSPCIHWGHVTGSYLVFLTVLPHHHLLLAPHSIRLMPPPHQKHPVLQEINLKQLSSKWSSHCKYKSTDGALSQMTTAPCGPHVPQTLAPAPAHDRPNARPLHAGMTEKGCEWHKRVSHAVYMNILTSQQSCTLRLKNFIWYVNLNTMPHERPRPIPSKT